MTRIKERSSLTKEYMDIFRGLNSESDYGAAAEGEAVLNTEIGETSHFRRSQKLVSLKQVIFDEVEYEP